MEPMSFPEHGLTEEEIRSELESHKLDERRAHWSQAFRGPKDVQEVGKRAFAKYMAENGLFSMRLPNIGDVETAVIDMCVSLFNPPEGASGTFTSGGSESIYSAIHAVREWANEKKPNITEPELVVPYSVHPAFSKACHYYGLKITRTNLGEDLRGSPRAMEDAISSNTVAMVASAPCWPYGLFDPIEKIGDIATAHDLWLHVDACVGGYLSPFVERLGGDIPLWDFRVPAVMSISADLHKFGYCPKPSSTVLWRSEDLKKYHFVHPGDWPGGTYSMTGIAGSRSCGPIFAAYSVLRYLGVDGYTNLARELMEKKRDLIGRVNQIDGLEAWDNDLMPIVIGTTDLDLQAVKAGMSSLGWVLIAAADPPLINIPFDVSTDRDLIDLFVSELADVAGQVREGTATRREALQY